MASNASPSSMLSVSMAQWGEPFNAFAYPIEDFYKSRYVKIAMTMTWSDRIADAMVVTFSDLRMFKGIERLIWDLATSARSQM